MSEKCFLHLKSKKHCNQTGTKPKNSRKTEVTGTPLKIEPVSPDSLSPPL
jgi:hypothetical protein